MNVQDEEQGRQDNDGGSPENRNDQSDSEATVTGDVQEPMDTISLGDSPSGTPTPSQSDIPLFQSHSFVMSPPASRPTVLDENILEDTDDDGTPLAETDYALLAAREEAAELRRQKNSLLRKLEMKTADAETATQTLEEYRNTVKNLAKKLMDLRMNMENRFKEVEEELEKLLVL